ncbi:hypothetical protein J6590_099577 [Homalodisca vitripennis]|nr:hypothetical protein J6590_099577 [Homalodisca vitripennis]
MAGCSRTLRDSKIDLVISSDCDDSSECSDVPEPCEIFGGIENVVRSDHSGSDGEPDNDLHQVTAQQTTPRHRRLAVRVSPPWSLEAPRILTERDRQSELIEVRSTVSTCLYTRVTVRVHDILLQAVGVRLPQSVEHETLNLRVVGSSPTLGAICNAPPPRVAPNARPTSGAAPTAARTTKPSDTGCRQVFALDGELVFTRMGLEVARVSLANVDGSSQYDALVQPEHEIIDFNTRFSGVTKEDYVLYKAKTLKQAQYDLFHYIKSDTILVGHGIENDLRALKIVHTLVVETTAIFPHEQGLPCRSASSSLAQEYLGKNIQTSATGHDSLEDAKLFKDLRHGSPCSWGKIAVVSTTKRPKIVLDAVPYEDRVALDVVEQVVLGFLQSFRLVKYVVLLGDSGEARVEVDDLVLGLDQSVVLARSVHVRQGHPSHLQTHPGEHKFAVQGEDLATPGVGGFGLHEPQQGTVRAAVGAAPDVGLAFGATLGGGALQMAPNVGLEPTTLRLRVSCSTD